MTATPSSIAPRSGSWKTSDPTCHGTSLPSIPTSKCLTSRALPKQTLDRARAIALSKGLHYVYTGNVHDPDGSSTWCPGCGKLLIERDWYELGEWNLIDNRCSIVVLKSPGTSSVGREAGAQLAVRFVSHTERATGA